MDFIMVILFFLVAVVANTLPSAFATMAGVWAVTFLADLTIRLADLVSCLGSLCLFFIDGITFVVDSIASPVNHRCHHKLECDCHHWFQEMTKQEEKAKNHALEQLNKAIQTNKQLRGLYDDECDVVLTLNAQLWGANSELTELRNKPKKDESTIKNLRLDLRDLENDVDAAIARAKIFDNDHLTHEIQDLKGKVKELDLENKMMKRTNAAAKGFATDNDKLRVRVGSLELENQKLKARVSDHFLIDAKYLSLGDRFKMMERSRDYYKGLHQETTSLDDKLKTMEKSRDHFQGLYEAVNSPWKDIEDGEEELPARTLKPFFVRKSYLRRSPLRATPLVKRAPKPVTNPLSLEERITRPESSPLSLEERITRPEKKSVSFSFT